MELVDDEPEYRHEIGFVVLSVEQTEEDIAVPEPGEDFIGLSIHYSSSVIFVRNKVENNENEAFQSQLGAVPDNVDNLGYRSLVITYHHSPCNPIKQIERMIMRQLPDPLEIQLFVVFGQCVHENILVLFEFGKLAVKVPTREHLPGEIVGIDLQPGCVVVAGEEREEFEG